MLLSTSACVSTVLPPYLECSSLYGLATTPRRDQAAPLTPPHALVIFFNSISMLKMLLLHWSCYPPDITRKPAPQEDFP
jgi:hypothetical protein